MGRQIVGIAALAAALWLGVAAPARAQTPQQRTEAKKVAGEALDLYKAGDDKAALEKFTKADGLVPAPTLKLYVARCLDKVDHMREAAEKYREVIAIELKPGAPKPHVQAREDAVKELAALLAQVPKLTVLVTGPGSEAAEVSRDGKPMSKSTLGEEQPMDPAFYQFEAKSGEKVARASVRLDRGKTERVELKFAADDAGVAGDKPRDFTAFRIAGFALVGVGGAAILGGAIAGGLALSDKSKAHDLYPDGTCNKADPKQDCSVAERLNSERTAASATLIAGSVVAATGAALLIYATVAGKPAEPAKPEENKAFVLPYLSPTGAGLFGTF